MENKALEMTFKVAIPIKVLGRYTQPSLRLRYWKVLKGKERRNFVALQGLEREKTQLTLCLAAAQSEILQDVQREVRRTESDMPDKTIQATVREPAFPLSPAPASTAADLVRYTKTQANQTPDTIMENVGGNFGADGQKNGGGSFPTDDKKKGTAPLNMVIQKIATTKAKTRQENTFGRAAEAGVLTHMRITEIIAEGEGSIQTNSF
ncbi:hypothetical protein BDZ45DRAFT_733986 [Acephala macrosclerotiorum]|nr:hypothetical protein BDZ45DRAFT_733986 [Acephala macrosclerotiorum]